MIIQNTNGLNALNNFPSVGLISVLCIFTSFALADLFTYVKSVTALPFLFMFIGARRYTVDVGYTFGRCYVCVRRDLLYSANTN